MQVFYENLECHFGKKASILYVLDDYTLMIEVYSLQETLGVFSSLITYQRTVEI